MPNEVDVELFRSFSLYNIYLMQLHGSALLERLQILLSLYKSHSILLSTTYYQGHHTTSLLLTAWLPQQSRERRCNVTLKGHPTNNSLTFGSVSGLLGFFLLVLFFVFFFLQLKRWASSQSELLFVTYEIWIELVNSY